MKITQSYLRAAHWLLPSPLTLAVLLSVATFFMAWSLTPVEVSHARRAVELAEFWYLGFWDLLAFAMQMMLILVLGHALALTRPVDKLITLIVSHCNTTSKSAFLVTLFTMLIGLFNWGLGLIFGALLARKIGEKAKAHGIGLNYALIGACGYSCMMVWHGGLSGSAPLKVAESNHFLSQTIGQIPLSDTLFSTMNLSACLLLLLIIPAVMAWMGRSKPQGLERLEGEIHAFKPLMAHPTGAERLDHSSLLCRSFALVFLLIAVYTAFIKPEQLTLNFVDLNFVNFLLFGLALWFLGTLSTFSQAVDEAIQGASGILVQFPLYAGIAGIMKYSGLIQVLSDFIVDVASPQTYALWAFMSAAVVNFFVPSGGGQWAVQGPILTDAALTLGVPYAQGVMAFAYGDQLTNMVQPFWALPLLAITKLKAQDILPYTFVMMIAAMFIFGFVLVVF